MNQQFTESLIVELRITTHLDSVVLIRVILVNKKNIGNTNFIILLKMNLFHVLWPMTVILACACVVSSSFGETAAAAASHHSTLSFEDATDVHARVEDRLGGTLGSSARMRRGIVQEARKTFLR